MKGGVYTDERCPVCDGKFQRTEEGLMCPIHLTRPRKCYVQVYNKQKQRAVNIKSDPNTRQPFTSFEQAMDLLTEIRREIYRKRGDFDATRYLAVSIKKFSFTNWSDDWLIKKKAEVEKERRSPSYLKALRVYLTKYQAFFGDTDIRDIGPEQINDFYLQVDGAPKYVKNIMDCLHKMLADALKWKNIHEMPGFPEYSEIPEVEIKTIDLKIQDMIIKSIPNQMDRIFILFTARQMVRPSETRALQWQDLDLEFGRVTIRRHFSLNRIRPATKAKQIKYLPLDGEVKEALKALPRHLTSPFVFFKGNGRPFSEAWARKIWAKACKKAGVSISLYQGTRHSSATEAADRVGIDATQEFLHHTNRKMTERYAKANPDRLKPVLRNK